MGPGFGVCVILSHIGAPPKGIDLPFVPASYNFWG